MEKAPEVGLYCAHELENFTINKINFGKFGINTLNVFEKWLKPGVTRNGMFICRPASIVQIGQSGN